jgi:hypothetical protein
MAHPVSSEEMETNSAFSTAMRLGAEQDVAATTPAEGER